MILIIVYKGKITYGHEDEDKLVKRSSTTNTEHSNIDIFI